MDAYIKISKDKFNYFTEKASGYRNNLINLKFCIIKELKNIPWYKKNIFSLKYINLNKELDYIIDSIDEADDIIDLLSQNVDYVYLDFYTYSKLVNEEWKVDYY